MAMMDGEVSEEKGGSWEEAVATGGAINGRMGG